MFDWLLGKKFVFHDQFGVPGLTVTRRSRGHPTCRRCAYVFVSGDHLYYREINADDPASAYVRCFAPHCAECAETALA